MPILSVKDLTKKFGKPSKEFTAVDNISFNLQEGEILGFLGPNGAGKTTTIQMLLGVLTPTSGHIEYFNKDLSIHREELLEDVNFSSTYTHLPWRLTVKENLTFLSYLYDIKERSSRMERIVEIFKLEELLNQEVSSLSAGQKTRVNLAKAFLNFPKILLLDEPTASLDPDIAQYIRDFLKDERKKFQMSILITSHNMAEVEELCDRVIFINHGKIVANDTPEKLARTIDICHIELMIRDGLKRVIDYAQKEEIPHKTHGRYITLDTSEKTIPEVLRAIMDAGVYYDEISIEKPTLEDYFLHISTKK